MMNKKGFTLIEVVVVVAIIALLAGILTPLIFKYIDEANQTRALGDCRNISTALLLFHKDTGTWPYLSQYGIYPPDLNYLYGNMGDMPRFVGDAQSSWGNTSDDMYFHLVTNGNPDQNTHIYRPKRAATMGGGILSHGWDGPYLPYVTDDPWAYKYVVSVGAFDYGPDSRQTTGTRNNVWCLSAGPNFAVETPIWATETHFDDIGYRTM